MSSPLASFYGALQNVMSARNEFHGFIADEHRRSILRSIFDAYYERVHPEKVVFDTNRIWSAKLNGLIQLFPQARCLCCVREIPWIIDSFERVTRSNAFEPSRMFDFESSINVYGRTEKMMASGGVIGHAYQSLKEAFYGEHADRLILVTYESLASKPRETMNSIYEILEEKTFSHDCETVSYDADQFDERFGMPGLHRVRKRIQFVERATILPHDIFNRHGTEGFWADPNQNYRNVVVI